MYHHISESEPRTGGCGLLTPEIIAVIITSWSKKKCSHRLQHIWEFHMNNMGPLHWKEESGGACPQ